MSDLIYYTRLAAHDVVWHSRCTDMCGKMLAPSERSKRICAGAWEPRWHRISGGFSYAIERGLVGASAVLST